jgi:NAD(P)-dependent dehydrogenase (short-subunit alcohol dehydrogenase family)
MMSTTSPTSTQAASTAGLPAPGTVDLTGSVVALLGDPGPVVDGIHTALARCGATVSRVRHARGRRFDPHRVEESGALEFDLADQPTAHAGLAGIAEQYGRLDALVSAHVPPAAQQATPMTAMTDETWQAVWEDTMRVMIYSLQGAYAQFLKSTPTGGRFVVLIPALAMTGGPGYSATSAMAEGQRLLMKSVARQWGPENVTANAITLANSVLLPGCPDFEFSLAERALGRTGDPETDIGPVVSFLCSDLARFVTGTTFFCEGGLWMTAA